MCPDSHRDLRRAACTAIALLLAAVLASCGQRDQRGASSLSFEELSDTAGVSQGPSILTALEPYRLPGGSLRVRGSAGLPDGTRLQITIVRVSTGETVKQIQVLVQDRAFESPPLMGDRGPFPPDPYRFDVLALFDATWQTAEVLAATDQGRRLRGPGMTRGNLGVPAFVLHQERRL